MPKVRVVNPVPGGMLTVFHRTNAFRAIRCRGELSFLLFYLMFGYGFANYVVKFDRVRALRF